MAKTVIKKGKKYWIMKNVYGKPILVPTFRTRRPGFALPQMLKYMRYGFSAKQVLKNSVNTTFMGKKITFHKLHYAQLKAAERDIVKYEKKIKQHYALRYVWTFSWRMIKLVTGGFGKTRSNHSFNIAIDINSDTNPFGGNKYDMPKYYEKYFKAHGARWLGAINKDYMHMEF